MVTDPVELQPQKCNLLIASMQKNHVIFYSSPRNVNSMAHRLLNFGAAVIHFQDDNYRIDFFPD